MSKRDVLPFYPLKYFIPESFPTGEGSDSADVSWWLLYMRKVRKSSRITDSGLSRIIRGIICLNRCICFNLVKTLIAFRSVGMEKPSSAKCSKSGPSLNCHLPGWMVYSAFYHCWQYRLLLCNIKPQSLIRIYFKNANFCGLLVFYKVFFFATWSWANFATVAGLGGFMSLYLSEITLTWLLFYQTSLKTVTSSQLFSNRINTVIPDDLHMKTIQR